MILLFAWLISKIQSCLHAASRLEWKGQLVQSKIDRCRYLFNGGYLRVLNLQNFAEGFRPRAYCCPNRFTVEMSRMPSAICASPGGIFVPRYYPRVPASSSPFSLEIPARQLLNLFRISVAPGSSYYRITIDVEEGGWQLKR